MKPMIKWTALTLAICLPLSAHAHRAWMLPSATVLSGEAPWVTVDAAVSNDLFYFEHFPLQLEGIGQPLQMAPRGAAPAAAKDAKPAPAPMRRPSAKLQILKPDGSQGQAEHGAVGRYRSTFDVALDQKGTYKLAVANSGLAANWKEGEERKRWMGKAEDFAAQVPSNAQELNVVQSSSRMEVFVTSGQPTDTVLKTTGKGLELSPVTHPNDLFAGEKADFVLLLDGKPAKDVEITVIPGGNRYRDQTGEINLKSDAQGAFSVTWPNAGMYWLEAEYSAKEGAVKPATAVRAVYSTTLEVLPQ